MKIDQKWSISIENRSNLDQNHEPRFGFIVGFRIGTKSMIKFGHRFWFDDDDSIFATPNRISLMECRNPKVWNWESAEIGTNGVSDFGTFWKPNCLATEPNGKAPKSEGSDFGLLMY